MNQHVPMQPELTVSKMTPQWKAPGLNSENIHRVETLPLIGTRFEKMQNLVDLMTSQPMYSFVIIALYDQLQLTTLCHWLESEKSAVIMGQPVWVRVAGPGRKRVQMHMLRIHALSFGAATVVKNALLWTNFEEVLTSVTYFDGRTGMQSLWKLRGVPLPFVQGVFGLRLTCILSRGIPSLISRRKVHCCDACKSWRSHPIYLPNDE